MLRKRSPHLFLVLLRLRATSLSGAKRTRSTSAAAARKTGSTSEIGRYTVCLYVKGMQTCSLPCF